jgi:hypothetical protein
VEEGAFAEFGLLASVEAVDVLLEVSGLEVERLQLLLFVHQRLLFPPEPCLVLGYQLLLLAEELHELTFLEDSLKPCLALQVQGPLLEAHSQQIIEFHGTESGDLQFDIGFVK